MPSKVKRPLKAKCDDLNATRAPTDFLSNLCKLRITQSDLLDFSHNFVNKLLIPELLKCTNTKPAIGTPKQITTDAKSIAAGATRNGTPANKVTKTQSKQAKTVPGYKIAQCIDVSSKLSPANRRNVRESRTEQKQNVEAAVFNKNKTNRNGTRTKLAPPKANLPAKVAAVSEQKRLGKQNCNETQVTPVAPMEKDAELSLIQAAGIRNGDLVISEIIIKFCKKC